MFGRVPNTLLYNFSKKKIRSFQVDRNVKVTVTTVTFTTTITIIIFIVIIIIVVGYLQSFFSRKIKKQKGSNSESIKENLFEYLTQKDFITFMLQMSLDLYHIAIFVD